MPKGLSVFRFFSSQEKPKEISSSVSSAGSSEQGERARDNHENKLQYRMSDC